MFGGKVYRRIRTEKSVEEVIELADDCFIGLGDSVITKDGLDIVDRDSSFWAEVEIKASFTETQREINVNVEFDQRMTGEAWIIAAVLFFLVIGVGGLVPFIFPIVAKSRVQKDINRCIDRLEASIEKT